MVIVDFVRRDNIRLAVLFGLGTMQVKVVAMMRTATESRCTTVRALYSADNDRERRLLSEATTAVA